MAEEFARPLRPHRFVFNGADKWRGGQVTATDVNNTTITLQAEEHIVRSGVSVATSLVPAGARSIGAQVQCRVTGSGASSYVIVEVLGSSGGPGTPSNAAAAVARGEFWPGIIGREITGESKVWDWSQTRGQR